MHNETGKLMAGGGTIFALALWGAISLWGTGPGIAKRTIEFSGWQQQCEKAVIKQAQRSHQSTAAPVPELNCSELYGALGKFGEAICKAGGHQALELALAKKRAVYEAAERKRQALIDEAASNAGTRCQCAISTTLEKNRISFGLYAGTFRIIEPVSVTNFRAELGTALGSPICSQKGRG